MNFSHGSYEYHQSVIDNTRKMVACECYSSDGVCMLIFGIQLSMVAPLQSLWIQLVLHAFLTSFFKTCYFRKGPKSVLALQGIARK